MVQHCIVTSLRSHQVVEVKKMWFKLAEKTCLNECFRVSVLFQKTDIEEISTDSTQ